MATLSIFLLLGLAGAVDLEFAHPPATAGAAPARVLVRVTPLPAFTGGFTRQPVLYGDNQQEVPLPPGFNSERFIGAATLVTYRILLPEATPEKTVRRRAAAAKLREKVTLLGQSEGLLERADFHKQVPFINGVASDIQMFGYDESAVAPGERAAVREQAKSLWRRFRQELFLDKDPEPFAVLVWTHTIEGIRLESTGGATPGSTP